MAENIYNSNKLTKELQAAKLPVASVSSVGRIKYSRDLTAAEKRSAAAVINAHDPSPTDETVILEQYARAGITVDKLIFALWKKVILEDSTDADALQSIINQVLSTINV